MKSSFFANNLTTYRRLHPLGKVNTLINPRVHCLEGARECPGMRGIKSILASVSRDNG